MNIKNGFQLLILLLLVACTPKPIETTKDTPNDKGVIVDATEETTPKDNNLSPCKNWLELTQEERKRVMITHSLYRDVMKNIGQASDLAKLKKEEFDLTFENWKTVFEVAPAADGKRNTHYGDGIKIYEFLASQEKDTLLRDKHIKKVLELYDEVIRCYGSEGTTIGRKAFDLYYKYPEHATDVEKYNMFKRSFDIEKEDAPAYIFNPFTNLLAGLVLDEKVSSEEGGIYAGMMLNILENNKAKLTAEKWTGEGWDIVASYAPERLKNLEGVKGFYDCEYYKEQYYSAFENAPGDCDSIILVLSRMKWADCPSEDLRFEAVYTAYRDKCRPVVDPIGPNCRDLLSEGNFIEAINCYSEKAEASTDNEFKATYYLTVAKIYYGELKQFSKARSAAYEALKYKSNWGDPYILIGKLYASSGPLCGPGRGWDSQIVTWPAIDKWQKAKRVDASVAAEANKLIGRYQAYMPSVEDIFQRSLKEGQSFKVPCWIQETTTIRAK
ncbi:MAG: tetratricopeptide (TPR) repeat protein [Saprospiraceae bacterium]|jgi:tetratricopeptide (TPR) repeat protein